MSKSYFDWTTKPLDFPRLKYISHPGLHETVEKFLEKYSTSDLFNESGVIFINGKVYLKYDKNIFTSTNILDENYYSKRIKSIQVGTYRYFNRKHYYFEVEYPNY